MNYHKIYNSIVNRAKQRIIKGYRENHHITPKCIGGNDSEENLVQLTAREHFICHLLLAKIYGGKLIHAAHMMSNMNRYNSKNYSWLREEHAKNISTALKGVPKSEEHKRKVSEGHKKRNKERKENGELHPNTGRKRTNEHNNNWYESRKNGAGWIVSDSRKKKLSEKMKGDKNPMWGKDHSEEAKEKIRAANNVYVICPYCSKEGKNSIMKRWHFDNCKHK